VRVLMIAPPGAGKGTQGERIAARFDVPHIATGDLLRDHVKRGTELGQTVQHHLDAGELAPDEVVLEMVREALEKAAETEQRGYVLDGIPRTISQARDLYILARDLEMTANVALHLEVGDDEILRRLLTRASAQGRSDDNEEVIRKRIDLYREVTQPILAWYEERGILVAVDGEGPAQHVTSQIFRALERIDPDARGRSLDPLEMESLEAAFGASQSTSSTA
jgi:adenylate kinase